MITHTDKRLAEQLQAKIDNLNKPKGSLGRLESLALQIGLIQHTLSPVLTHPCHVLFGADHGIEREGVSVSPRDVTWQQMENFCRGGGGVNMFCRQHGFQLFIVDAGTDHDFDHSKYPQIIDHKIAYGTANFIDKAAMTTTQYETARRIGGLMTDKCAATGCNVISFGEMGIANTSPSSLWMHYFCDIPLSQCVGAGAGLASEGVRHKLDVLSRAATNFDKSHDTPVLAEETIRWFGGFEMVAAIGGMLRAAERNMVILVDGFIMSACMLAASKIDEAVLDYAVFGHCGDESGHKLMLDAMGAKPLLNLGLRLGEGTGAICAYPLLQSAINMINEMDNFDHAEITKYF